MGTIRIFNKGIGLRTQLSRVAESAHIAGTATDCDGKVLKVEAHNSLEETASGTTKVHKGRWHMAFKNVSLTCDTSLDVRVTCEEDPTCEERTRVRLNCIRQPCPWVAWPESVVGDCNPDGTRNVTTTFDIWPLGGMPAVGQCIYTGGEPLIVSFTMPPDGELFTDTHAFPAGTGERYPVTIRFTAPAGCEDYVHELDVIEPCP